MIIVKTIKYFTLLLEDYKRNGRSVGFVPTMGALHQGHISLIQYCKNAHPVCVSSIFVNPAQFNNAGDFQKYPFTIEKDIDMLEQAGCDVLFLPTVIEMYPPGEVPINYPLGYLETILEGEYRPGHFQGVCRIVDKLLSIVKPVELFLGQKDYQQCMVIKKLIILKNYNILVKILPTVRETNGLAMSSRNMRLTRYEKQKAMMISVALFTIRDEILPGNIEPLKTKMKNILQQNSFKVDYVEVADSATLETIETWDGKQTLVALIAAYLNDIRLIDNLIISA